MRNRLRSCASFGLFLVALASLGCFGNDDEGQAMAAPTTTGIPVGAPGAVGARLEPPPPPSLPPRIPRTESLEQKINPSPEEPTIPPSPFGSPPNDDPLAEPTPKKPKGTKL